MNPRLALTLLVPSLLSVSAWYPEIAQAQAAPTSASAVTLRAFDRVRLIEESSETSASVSIGDIDGDGDPDVVLAKGRHWPLADLVLRNDGKGVFSTATLSDAPDRTYTAALADLDGDGDLDLAVSNDRPDKKLIYRNDGTGRFTVAGTFGQPEWSTRYVTVADLNGDKRPDLIVANRSSNAANPKPSFVCLNEGNATFGGCTALPTQSATIIVAADLDADGHVDLFVPHRDGGQNVVLWNDGRGGFNGASTAVGPAKSSIRAAAVADIDGDGALDLVVGDQTTGLFRYRNAGGRRFDAPIALSETKGSPYSIAIADLNRDGLLDIVVGNDEAPGTLLFRTNDRTRLAFVETSWNDGKGAVYGVAIADLDGDGWPDIVGARSDAPNAIWFNGPLTKR
jgi:hypothetical protein